MFVAQEFSGTADQVEAVDVSEKTPEELGKYIADLIHTMTHPVHVFPDAGSMEVWCEYHGFTIFYIEE